MSQGQAGWGKDTRDMVINVQKAKLNNPEELEKKRKCCSVESYRGHLKDRQGTVTASDIGL
jgi:hypothetical protein